MNKITQTIKSFCLAVAALAAGICHGKEISVSLGQSIDEAINSASAGDTILLAPGTYQYNDAAEYDFWTDKALTIKCAVEGDYAIIDGNGFPVKFIPAADSVASGIVFQNAVPNTNPGTGVSPFVVRAKSGVTVTNCIVRNCTIDKQEGCAVYVDGGSLLNSFITNNTASVQNCWTAGVHIKSGRVADCDISYNKGPATGCGSGGIAGCQHGGLVERCTILHNENTARTSSGTIWDLERHNSSVYSPNAGITNRNCLFAYNIAASENYGAGAVKIYGDAASTYDLILENATVCFNENVNTAKDGISAGGKCTIRNCMAWQNGGDADDKTSILTTAASDSKVTISYSCFPEGDKQSNGTTYTGCIHDEPRFVNAAAGDFHLATGSAGIDAAMEIAGVTDDLDGNARPVDNDGDGVARSDIGCYECREQVDASYFVWVSSTGRSEAPYNTPETGFADINAALDHLAAQHYGLGTIQVAAGTYAQTDAITLNGRVAIVGEPGKSVVSGAGLKLNNMAARVSGLTFESAQASAEGVENSVVYVTAGMMTNCVVRNCSTEKQNASIVYLVGGSLVDCVVSNNTVGAVYAATVRIAGGTVKGSSIVYNKTTDSGAFAVGVWQQGGLICDSDISHNTGNAIGGNGNSAVVPGSEHGVGAGGFQNGGIMERCTISYNENTYSTANKYAAGGWHMVGAATNRNCLIVHNKTLSKGGVGGIKVDNIVQNKEQTLLENATISRNENSQDGSVDGVFLSFKAVARNCIAYGNGVGGNVNDDIKIYGSGTFENSCYGVRTANNTDGTLTDCINGDPKFRNAGAGDFHLKGTSLCINTGDSSSYGAKDLDLDGRKRIVGNIVDMGCYEYRPGGLVIMVK